MKVIERNKQADQLVKERAALSSLGLVWTESALNRIGKWHEKEKLKNWTKTPSMSTNKYSL